MGEQLNVCETLRDRIAKEIQPDPPQLVNKGDVIADGYNAELDDLRSISRHGKDYLLKIQEREIEQTGISSLKVGYNNVFGYYLEVRNTFKDKVPAEWIRKQTLAQAERYITQELKEYEEKILGADEKILILEAQLFNELIARCRSISLRFRSMPTSSPVWIVCFPLRRHRMRTAMCALSSMIRRCSTSSRADTL